jgi:hypothetical protein
MLQPLGLQQKISFSSSISHSFTIGISWKVAIINLLDVSYCWEIFWLFLGVKVVVVEKHCYNHLAVINIL